MNLIYQGVPGAYSNLACLKAAEMLDIKIDKLIDKPDFSSVWDIMDKNNIGVLPVENSYAGNIHENLYNFLRHDFKIIGEINLEVNHCLLSNETEIDNIKEVYSHPQALSQTHNFLKHHKIKPVDFGDTAGAAQMISEENKKGVGAIASSLAGEIYGLNILREGIQDQNGNTTRFFIIAPSNSELKIKNPVGKTSIIFEARNIPSSLYKCLGAFATNNVNLTKIESMPSLKDPFTYMFWLDFEGKIENDSVKKSLEELDFFTNEIKILGEY